MTTSEPPSRPRLAVLSPMATAAAMRASSPTSARRAACTSPPRTSSSRSIGADGRRVGAGESGEIVVTHLATRDFPFIRYRTGDVGILDTSVRLRSRPAAVAGNPGRSTDFVVAADGTVMHGLALIYVIRDLAAVAAFKIIQESVALTRVVIVPRPPFPPPHPAEEQHPAKKPRLDDTKKTTKEESKNAPQERGEFREGSSPGGGRGKRRHARKQSNASIACGRPMNDVAQNQVPADAAAQRRARLIAFYLPQFHPIPENDEWWGKGFTEWTNAAKAKPMFRGHYQPHVPADLGFYDLRVPETRQAQADMARAYGIEAFCYYHYWFAGHRILERPFDEVVRSGQPDFPFCVCWANQTWTGIWHGAPDRVLIEQTYPGDHDHRAHFESLLPAFADPRHLTVDGKPLFAIYRPLQIPEPQRVTDLWRTMAVKAGLKGLHLVGVTEDADWNPQPLGFDASTSWSLPERRPWVSKREPKKWLRRQYELLAGKPSVFRYADVVDTLMPASSRSFESYPMLLHAWDNTPRSGKDGLVLHDSRPDLFRRLLRSALEACADAPPERRIVFVKSWNEWAEGNHLEPDLRFGHGYLKVIQEELRLEPATVPEEADAMGLLQQP